MTCRKTSVVWIVSGNKPKLTNFTPFLLVDFYMLYTNQLLRQSAYAHTFIYLNVKITTLSNGYLGSRNDEERSEMRYVMRIAEFSESSNLWTQIALLGSPRSTPLSVSVQQPLSSVDSFTCWLDNESLNVTIQSLEIHRVSIITCLRIIDLSGSIAKSLTGLHGSKWREYWALCSHIYV